jgi:hypothetical protein
LIVPKRKMLAYYVSPNRICWKVKQQKMRVFQVATNDKSTHFAVSHANMQRKKADSGTNYKGTILPDRSRIIS